MVRTALSQLGQWTTKSAKWPRLTAWRPEKPGSCGGRRSNPRLHQASGTPTPTPVEYRAAASQGSEPRPRRRAATPRKVATSAGYGPRGSWPRVWARVWNRQPVSYTRRVLADLAPAISRRAVVIPRVCVEPQVATIRRAIARKRLRSPAGSNAGATKPNDSQRSHERCNGL
jgi:hypothetical protein